MKEACPWLRRTRALCKFNGGKERPEDTAELCGSAQCRSYGCARNPRAAGATGSGSRTRRQVETPTVSIELLRFSVAVLQ